MDRVADKRILRILGLLLDLLLEDVAFPEYLNELNLGEREKGQGLRCQRDLFPRVGAHTIKLDKVLDGRDVALQFNRCVAC